MQNGLQRDASALPQSEQAALVLRKFGPILVCIE
jgi:hypothetical protein